MKSPGISKNNLLAILLPFLARFTLPQSQNNVHRITDTSLPQPPTVPLPPHSSSLIIPASILSPDATVSYLITFTPTSTPALPLSRDAVNYCFSRLTVLASRQAPPLTPFGRPLICTLADCEVVLKPVTAWVMNYGEVEYLLGEVGAWIAGRGGEEKGWYEEGVQRWYRGTRAGQRVELVVVEVGREGDEAGGGTGGGGDGVGVGGGVDVDR